MNYTGIILTGTSGSGKSTIAKRMIDLNPCFKIVKAVTTRNRRVDDMPNTYDYLTEEEFHLLRRRKMLFVQAEYREHSYGIRLEEIERTKIEGRVPILTITPESAACIKGAEDEFPEPFLSIFVDAPDDILNSRLEERGSTTPNRQVVKQRDTDRNYKEKFIYITDNLDLESTVKMLLTLWDYSKSAGVISDRLMRLMLRCGILLKDANERNISGASYDLSLGDEYFYGGKIHRLNDQEPILLIEPYDYAIVTSNEISNLPRDVCARFDLSVSLFCQGVIISNGPQIDPGFIGPLFCLLFNTSSSPVLLKRRQHYATIEFHKLIEPTYRYRGQYKAKDLLHYLPSNAAQGAINVLKKELEQVRKESQNLQNIILAVLSLIFAFIAVWVTIK